MPPDLSGKVAIITGGASGIGKGLAEELAKLRCDLVLADINEELLQETAAELGAPGRRVRGQPVDVRDAKQVQSLVQDTYDEYGRIDFMFNNAGVNVCAELRDTTLEDWNFLIDVNLRGVINGVHAVYPIMREQGFGHIVNTASLAGLVPTPTEGAYSATKHAVVALSGALRAEAAHLGIRVTAICPGVIETPMMKTTKFVRVDGEEALTIVPGKPMSVRKASRIMINGVLQNRALVVVTPVAHFFWRMYRMAPEQSIWYGKRIAKKFRKIRRA